MTASIPVFRREGQGHKGAPRAEHRFGRTPETYDESGMRDTLPSDLVLKKYNLQRCFQTPFDA